MSSTINVLLLGDAGGELGRIEQILRGDPELIAGVERHAGLGVGIERLRTGKIDVVILDLSCSSYSSIEQFEQFYQKAEGIPIIVLGTKDDQSLALDAVRVGAQDFLLRGEIERSLLLRALRYAIDRNRLHLELEESRRLERHLAYHDFLTGLPNRLLLIDRLGQILNQGRRLGEQVSLLLIDLDGFKRINDTLGHGVGDQLLKGVSERLQDTVRESDTVARLGGDEFTVTLSGLTDNQTAAKVASKIRDVMTAPFQVDGHELFLTISIGISTFPNDGSDAETMIQKAGVAMCRAKDSGRNSFKQYKFSMDASFAEHLSLESRLRRAIDNDELRVYYQPQIKLETGEIMGSEALVRWQHPTLGLVPPAKFIPLAEEIGIIAAIDEWVLRSACEQTSKWESTLGRSLQVAVNLSAQKFRKSNLPKIVAEVLQKTGISPGSLCIEITESNVMQNLDHTNSILHALKSLGVQLSVDDFGKGYSSLNYLKTFPIDILKVDRSFVSGIPIDRNDMAICTAIVVLAQSMALKVVAEGVETADQLSFFKSLNCDVMQGYYFSPPVPVAELTRLLQERRQLMLDEPVLLDPASHND